MGTTTKSEATMQEREVVLVWKFDRFARSLKMLVEYLTLFEELGIDFISHQENIDTTTSMGKLIFHINSAYAEFERSLIKERVAAGVKRKREKTGYLGQRKVERGNAGEDTGACPFPHSQSHRQAVRHIYPDSPEI